MGTPWWNMPSRGILGSMICRKSRGGLRGERGPQVPLLREGERGFRRPRRQAGARGRRYSPAPGRRGTPGTWPTPGPGHPGRNPRPRTATPRRAPCPCAPLCRRRGERGVSCVLPSPGDGASRARGRRTYCRAPRLAPCPRSRTRSPSPTCPRCCPPGSSLGRRRVSLCPAWRALCCGEREQSCPQEPR